MSLSNPEDKKKNGISLIVAAKNEEKSIENLLDSISNQTKLPDELIITDGGSSDETCRLIEGHKINELIPVKLIKEKSATPGKGRNIAIKNSSNDLIAITDAGIVLHPNWLKSLYGIQQKTKADVVYGNYEPISDTFFLKCAVLTYVPKKVIINGRKIRTHFIASSLLKKKVWEDVGGFPDFRAAEDRIFIQRIERRGYKIEYAPGATVYWEIPSSFRSTFKRFNEFSYHDIIAGRAKDWHYPVIRMYIIGLIFLLLGIVHNFLWILLIPILTFVRAIKLIIERTEKSNFIRNLNPIRILLVSVLTISIDMAMFTGALRWLWMNKLRFKKKA